jgi:hypothetical protein
MGRSTQTVGFALAFWLCVLGPQVADPIPIATPAAANCIPASQCCKVCDKGQACGNSCISRAKQCHKGRGCACNSSEVCAEP